MTHPPRWVFFLCYLCSVFSTNKDIRTTLLTIAMQQLLPQTQRLTSVGTILPTTTNHTTMTSTHPPARPWRLLGHTVFSQPLVACISLLATYKRKTEQATSSPCPPAQEGVLCNIRNAFKGLHCDGQSSKGKKYFVVSGD